MLMVDFTWSYSSLKDYTGCPKRYYEIKVAKNYEVPTSQQMLYGKEVHKALEDYVRDGTPLPKNYERFKSMVDELIAIPGVKYPEYEMGLTHDKKACEFNDPNRWVRGIADLVIVDGDTAFIIDYKTGGNKYPDPKQLRLMSLMVFEHFPEVNHIKAGLLFVMHNSFITEEYNRAEIEASWAHFTAPLALLKHSYESGKWVPNPTPLCRYCPVHSCEFNER
jgi:CRISPR/Cas system-associated exonuclease Cas4 (RecB family)